MRLLADPGDVDGVVRRRVPVHRVDRWCDDVVLRLVRRSAGGFAAGVRRPDGCTGIRGLVGRVVSDDVGLQRPGHPHTRRALDGRGSLSRNESRQREPRLRRQHEVRRRVDAVRGGHRRRAWDGDGSRDPVGVLRTEANSVLRRLCAALHRSSVPDQARGARRCPGAREEPHRRRPRRRRCGGGECRIQTGAARRGHRYRRGAQGFTGIPVRRRRCRQVEPRTR